MSRLHALFAAVALVAACSEDVAPVDPVWGKQPCASCGMIVGDRRFAAQLLAPSGVRSYFDDPGCLVHYLEDRKLVPQGMWVHEVAADRWLDARRARYATTTLHTPMDFGYEARSDQGLSFEAFSEAIQKKAKR